MFASVFCKMSLQKTKRINPNDPIVPKNIGGLGQRKMFSEDVGTNKYFYQCAKCKTIKKYREAAEACFNTHMHKGFKCDKDLPIGYIVEYFDKTTNKLSSKYKVVKKDRLDSEMFHYDAELVEYF